jgi:hypothetical protein
MEWKILSLSAFSQGISNPSIPPRYSAHTFSQLFFLAFYFCAWQCREGISIAPFFEVNFQLFTRGDLRRIRKTVLNGFLDYRWSFEKEIVQIMYFISKAMIFVTINWLRVRVTSHLEHVLTPNTQLILEWTSLMDQTKTVYVGSNQLQCILVVGLK